MRGPAAWISAVALLGCATGPVDVAALAARHPRLAAAGAHRLGDLTPYLLPVKGELWWFTCRWPEAGAIPVSLPPDADAEERALIRRALDALARAAGVGFREEPAAKGGASSGILIRFVENTPERSGGGLPPTATTLAECAVDPAAWDGAASRVGDVIPARLRVALVELTRGRPDLIGREEPHAEAELMGSVLHELGHALGFQGHARRGDTVMVRSVDEVRWAGRTVLAGQPLDDPTLRALYALPSGTLVARGEVGLAETDSVDHLSAVAARVGLHGPTVRVGDAAGQVLWRDDAGNPYGFQIPQIRAVLEDPAAFRLLPSERTTRLLNGTP